MTQISQTGTCKKSTEHPEKLRYGAGRAQSTEHKKLKTKNSLDSGFWVLGSSLKGFTLIELIVVIFIISLATALIMPSFWATEKTTLKTEARHLSSALRYIHNEALAKKQTYLLNINLDNQVWGYKSEKESRSFKMKDDVEIRDIMVPSLGEVSKGEVLIEFGPMGPEEPIIFHLQKGESEYTVFFNHINGRTKVFEGYTL